MHFGQQLDGEMVQNVASGGESAIKMTEEVDNWQVLGESEISIAGSPWRVPAKEAPIGVEPMMADLQSAALATWLLTGGSQLFDRLAYVGEKSCWQQIQPFRGQQCPPEAGF